MFILYIFIRTHLNMVRLAKSKKQKVNEIICQFKEEFTKTPSGDLYCKICNTIINCNRKSSVIIHRKTKIHQNGKATNISEPTFLTTRDANVTKIILSAFLSADIPLWKLRNIHVRNMFNALGHPAPSETTCRNQLNVIYQEEYLKIKKKLENKQIFFIADESFYKGTKFFNILVGDIEYPQKTYLVDSIIVEVSLDSDAVVDLIKNSLLQNLEISQKMSCFL